MVGLVAALSASGSVRRPCPHLGKLVRFGHLKVDSFGNVCRYLRGLAIIGRYSGRLRPSEAAQFAADEGQLQRLGASRLEKQQHKVRAAARY